MTETSILKEVYAGMLLTQSFSYNLAKSTALDSLLRVSAAFVIIPKKKCPSFQHRRQTQLLIIRLFFVDRVCQDDFHYGYNVFTELTVNN